MTKFPNQNQISDLPNSSDEILVEMQQIFSKPCIRTLFFNYYKTSPSPPPTNYNRDRRSSDRDRQIKKMVQRQVFARHVSWNTRSNRHRMLKTPGGRLVYHIVKKKASTPKCGDTKKPLQGVPRLRPIEYSRLKKRQRHVSRAYGGTLSAGAVRSR